MRRGADGSGAEHRFDDLLDDPDAYRAWLEPLLVQLHRVLAATGSLFLHLDHRMSAHARIALDAVFGRDGFRNEIVWRYGLGGRAPANAFARKHDVLLFYARGPGNTFHRLRGDVTPAMAAKYAHEDAHGRYQRAHGRRYYLKGGKPFDSVWDIPSIAPTARERTGYPTQKPLALLERVMAATTDPGRARDRPLRRQRHDGRRSTATGPPLHRGRQLAAGALGDLRAPRARGTGAARAGRARLLPLILGPLVSTIGRRETRARWRTSVSARMESGHPAGECMYQYSRAIFLAVKDLVDESQPGVSRVEAQRRVLAACEAAVERLAADPRYFARPTRSLFEEIRRYFPITQQARVYVAVDEVISRVVEAAEAELQRRSDLLGRCRALTRKGQPCQRGAMPESEYCPSHAHLDERIAAGFVAA